MRVVRLLTVSILFLVSCKGDEFYASIDRRCPVNNACFDAVHLVASGGDWRCHGHSPGFYREVHQFEILLPSAPSPHVQTHYDFALVRLKVDSPLEELAVVIPLTNGQVKVNQRLKTLIVNFETPQGAFWANGTYPIR